MNNIKHIILQYIILYYSILLYYSTQYMYLSYSYSVTHRHEHYKFIWLVPRCDLYTSCSSFSVQSRTCDFCNTIYYIIHNIILIRSVVTVNNDH